MAAVPADNVVRPPAGPGALANRQDLTGRQPIRIPTGLPYGQAGQLQHQEEAVPLPQNGPAALPGPPQGSPQGAPGPGAPEDPKAILAAVAGHPTDFPNMPLANKPQTTLSDLLGSMATQPNAPPDVVALADLARRLGV